MEYVTTKNRGFSPKLMARVDACAYIFMAEKPEKINAIMERRHVPELEAGRIYVIGALKAAKRRGIARTYQKALELLEMEQVGDRGDPLTRTISADNTARVIAKYRRMNDNSPMRTNRLRWPACDPAICKHGDTCPYAPESWLPGDGDTYSGLCKNDCERDVLAWYDRNAKKDKPLYTWYDIGGWETVDSATKEVKRTHTVNAGKALGTMYTEWENRTVQEDPVCAACNAVIERNMAVFFKEYTSRLSKTVKMRLADLAGYIRRESGGNTVLVDRVIQALTSAKGAKGREAPETSKLANFAANLHRHFEHKDAITCREFISLLYQYSDIS
jgi:hypothetical protein